MNPTDFKTRNPLLIIVWSFFLFVVMQTWQYLGTWFAALLSDSDFESIISGKFVDSTTIFIMGLTSAIIGVPLAFLIIKYLWRRSSTWMCLQFNLKYLISGISLGLLIPLIILLVLMILGDIQITKYPNRFANLQIVALLIGHAGLCFFTGLAEETVFRGMVIREFAIKWGWLAATIIGGAYFGLLHLISNFQKLSLLEAIWIVVAGMLVSALLVSLLLRSQSLWLPIGFHSGWNFCLVAILGTTMSGEASNFGLFNIELSGNTIFTGGPFGFEASLISLIFYIVIAILVIRFPKKKSIILLENKPSY